MSTDRDSRKHGAEILLGALGNPAGTISFGVEDWDLLLRLARATRLLGRLAVNLDELGLLEKVPPKVTEHCSAARVFVDHRQGMARWEISRILKALDGLDVPIVLLKGGAYILAGLPPARGRLLSDVDLLVPAASLDDVEQALLDNGWESVKLEEYDQRYYRTWMHELPPLRHPDRGLEVDIHHTISPLTSRLNPDPDKLFRDSIPLADSRLRVLQPVDMVLHSAVHLFYDGELINGLRDLVDLADLFSHYGNREGFWGQLVQRAREQRLQRPLFYAMRYTQRLLGTDIPATAMADINTGAPARLVLRLMDRLIMWVMVPDHPDFPQRGTALAQWLLYVRSHWLRMPPGLLLKHLVVKQVMRWKHRKSAAAAAATVQQ
jgi:hypothetical protein